MLFGNCVFYLAGDARAKGANVILLQELFASTYFPIEQHDYFRHAISLEEDPKYITRFQSLARELNVVLPLSFYERANTVHFNSVVVIDSDGSQLGVYRKSHIPDSPGYQEKYYFSPGDTGFKVFKTRVGTIGVGICWDQWFPEAARCMVLAGAEILLYPTAIGSEPQDPAMDTCAHWQRCMQGHSAANMVPIIASNRIGKECADNSDTSITFYGSSFITDHTGMIVSDAGRHQETVLVHSFNMEEMRYARLQWGMFRDRRPDLYTALVTYDGQAAPVERRLPYPAVTSFPAPRNSLPSTSVPGLPAPKKLVEGDTMGISTGMNNGMNAGSMTTGLGGGMLGEQPAPRVVGGPTIDLHDATYIGDVKLSAQRRPRGRCWVCRAKTTYECKACSPGPVPLCNRTARDCWWKYHVGEISQFVPNKRGRKRRKDSNDLDDLQRAEDSEDDGKGVPNDHPVPVGNVGVNVNVGAVGPMM